MDWEEILKSIQAGKQTGILTAAAYMRNLTGCLGDDTCAKAYLDGLDLSKWSAHLKEAESKLVYHNDDMVVTGGHHVSTNENGILTTRQFGAIEARNRGVVPNSILDFDHVITSTRKDRDGDIMESAGADVDLKMALLWQHLPFMPIGKFVGITDRSNQKIAGSSAIVDVPLGRDAATLVEAGALRISHGFIPVKFEPLEKTRKDDPFPPGFRVTEFKIVEVSLVSIPSNVDAVITAFSREKLCHPLVKAWAGNLAADRKTVVVVPPGVPLAPVPPQPVKHSCSCSAATDGTAHKAMSQSDQDTLKSAMAHCQSAMDHEQCPVAAKTMLERANGLIGEVSGAEPDADDKAIKRASRQKVKKLRDAHGHITHAGNHGGMPSACKTLCGKAASLVQDVAGKHDDGTDDEKLADYFATQLIGLVLTGNTVHRGILAELKSVIDEAYSAAQTAVINEMFNSN